MIHKKMQPRIPLAMSVFVPPRATTVSQAISSLETEIVIFPPLMGRRRIEQTGKMSVLFRGRERAHIFWTLTGFSKAGRAAPLHPISSGASCCWTQGASGRFFLRQSKDIWAIILEAQGNALLLNIDCGPVKKSAKARSPLLSGS